MGGDLHPETLLLAYRQGIFPWPIEGAPTHTWFCPPERGILEFRELHLPRSLEKFRKKQPYRFTFNQAFERIIQACAAAYRPGQPGTWITAEMKNAYLEFHHLGHAQSVEAWDEVGNLVGGLYGVMLEGVFAGESMFHLQPNASKLALLALVDRLAAHGMTWMDIQVLTPHMESLGARLIARDEFLEKLSAAQKHHAGGKPLRL